MLPLAKKFWPLGTYHKMEKTCWLLSFRLLALAPANFALNSLFWLYHLLLNLVTMLPCTMCRTCHGASSPCPCSLLSSPGCHAKYLSNLTWKNKSLSTALIHLSAMISDLNCLLPFSELEKIY